jgi:hypothetical protein
VTRVRGVFAALFVVLLASGARAQVVNAPPPPNAGKAGEEPSEDESDEADEKSDEPGTATKSGKAPEVEADTEKPLPPPPPPRASDQFPPPYDKKPDPIRNVRHVEIGPDFGVWSRSAKDDSASYGAGFAYGAHARVEILPVLGFSIYANNAHHEVTVADQSVDQPALQVFQMGARLEPTWPVLPTLRLWLGLGVAWGRASADAPTVNDIQDSSMADRAGVFLEYSAALGGTYDVIPNWLALSLSVSGGVMTNQSGDLFDDTQAITNNGQMSRLSGLPEMESGFSALLGVGMIL